MNANTSVNTSYSYKTNRNLEYDKNNYLHKNFQNTFATPESLKKFKHLKKHKKSTDNTKQNDSQNLKRNKPVKLKLKNFNSYQYQYQNHRLKSSTSHSTLEYMQLKLSDLINPSRNKTFIDNLYAQFEPNSNKINLVYIPPQMKQLMEQQQENGLVLLANQSFSSSLNSFLRGNTSSSMIDTSRLLNEFYLNAAYLKQTRTKTSKS